MTGATRCARPARSGPTRGPAPPGPRPRPTPGSRKPGRPQPPGADSRWPGSPGWSVRPVEALHRLHGLYAFRLSWVDIGSEDAAVEPVKAPTPLNEPNFWFHYPAPPESAKCSGMTE